MEAISSGTGEQSSGPPAFHANAFQAFNLKGGCQEGRGGERAGSARLSPEIGSLHLPRRLARSLAPPRCSRPCFSRGKREGKKDAGRIWEGEGLGGGWDWGPGRPAPGQPAGKDRAPQTPRLARLQRLGRRVRLPGPPPPAGPGARAAMRAGSAGRAARGAAAEPRALHLSADPGRVPRGRRPPVCEPRSPGAPPPAPRWDSGGRGCPRLEFYSKRKCSHGPRLPKAVVPGFQANNAFESCLLMFMRSLSQVKSVTESALWDVLEVWLWTKLFRMGFFKSSNRPARSLKEPSDCFYPGPSPQFRIWNLK